MQDENQLKSSGSTYRTVPPSMSHSEFLCNARWPITQIEHPIVGYIPKARFGNPMLAPRAAENPNFSHCASHSNYSLAVGIQLCT
jgi:hypothetical protein